MKKEHFKKLKEARKSVLLNKKEKDKNGLYPGCYVWVDTQSDEGLEGLPTNIVAVVQECSEDDYSIFHIETGYYYGQEGEVTIIQETAWYPIESLTKISKEKAKEPFKLIKGN